MKSAIIYDKWLSGLGGGEVVACTMATTLRDNGYEVTLVSQDTVSPDEIKSKLGIDIEGIKLSTQLPTTNYQLPIDLFINTSFMDYTYGFAKKNIYYVHFPTVSNKSLLNFVSKSYGLKGLYKKYLSTFPSGFFNYVLTFFKITKLHRFLSPSLKERIDDRLRAGIYHNLPSRLKSYQIFVTHSKYVKRWIKKAWGINAQVLYPPVNLLTTNYQLQTTKKNWICSLGRFFTLGHGKKQEIMIEAFKKIISNNQYPITSDLQLHLIGGVGEEPSSIRFIEKLMESAKGYPIFFHLNVARDEVEDVLLKSKIYWHAAGFGEDPEKDPIKFEHFGIAPIEAISAGCVPILFNGGGLTEIVDKLGLSKDKHLFNSVEELIEKTKLLMNETLPKTTQEKVIKLFSKERFASEFLKLIAS